MRFLFYFRLSSYLLIAAGFFALIVTEDYGVVAGLLFALIILAGWKLDAGDWVFRLSPFWWNVATIGVLFICIADALYIRRLRSIALLNFLIFLQATKILRPKLIRDYVTIYVISFFELLASSILTLSILFAVSCIFFAITATWALSTLYLRKEIETYVLHTPKDAHPEPEMFNLPALHNLLNRRFFVGTLGVTILTFGMALAIFLILPRMREGVFFRYGADVAQRVSGFSEEVALDTFGVIRENHQPVMQVFLPTDFDPNTLPTRLYWRGISFNYYDGKRWRADPIKQRALSVSRFERTYWFQGQTDTRKLLVQRVMLASPHFEVIFGADSIQGAEGTFLSLQYDRVANNTALIYDPYHPEYRVYSKLTTPSAESLRQETRDYPETITDYYVQTPEVAPRITALAHQITDQQPTVYDMALAVQDYLLRNYAYSLDVQRTLADAPLEDFLFVNTAGHCEYYATSMAILLRLVGIPTRIVNGFAQGRWNEFGHFFTVRQSDAHSWVEVYFPSAGWVTFDPTPSTAFGETYQQFAEQPGLLASLYRYSEYLRTRWNRYVVDYSREDQARAIVSAFIATRSTQYQIREWLSWRKQQVEKFLAQISWRQIGLGLFIFGLGALALYWLTRLFRQFSWQLPVFRIRKRQARKRIIQFYQTMLRLLARQGLTRDAAATPGEFARYVAQQNSAMGEEVHALTNLYYAVRYGSAELSQTDLLRIEGFLQRLKHQPRKRSPTHE